MLLHDISLYLMPDEYLGDHSVDVSAFEFRGRYLCNYLRRKVQKLRFNAERFRAILVQGRRGGCEPVWISGNDNLVSPVRFDQARYDNLKPGEQHEFFISMLVEGLHKAARHHKIPLKEILGFIEDFRRGGYKNEWVHKTKLLRGTGLRAGLLCSMDSERFQLTLKLERKGEVVFQEVILEELPDETCFHYQFKDVTLKGGKVVVTRRSEGTPTEPAPPLFVLDLKSLDAPGAAGRYWFQIPTRISYLGTLFTLTALPEEAVEKGRFDKATLKLADVVEALHSLDKRARIYARKPWTTSSKSLVIVPNGKTRLQELLTRAGYELFASYHSARQVLLNVPLRSLNAEQMCELLVHHVEHGSYPAWFKPPRSEHQM